MSASPPVISWRARCVFPCFSRSAAAPLTHALNFSYRAATMTQMVQLMQMRFSEIRLLTAWIDPECGEGEVCLR
jgi:hypothetical protein